jgi:hypothetical protein
LEGVICNHHGIKRETDNERNDRKYSNTWRLNNSPLNDQWVTEEIREKTEGFLEANENENTTYYNLWDIAKAVLRGKFIAIVPMLTNQGNFK